MVAAAWQRDKRIVGVLNGPCCEVSGVLHIALVLHCCNYAAVQKQSRGRLYWARRCELESQALRCRCVAKVS